MSNIHITALFATSQAAHAARDSMVAAGIDASRILVLDRGHAETAAPTRRAHNGLWGALKQMFVHDDDARHYADSIVRGNPLLVADVSDAERAAALNTLDGFGPVKLEAQDEGTSRVGVRHEASVPAQEWIASTYRDAITSGNEGIVGGSVLAGDYGSVGAVHGAAANTDILRGMRFAEPRAAVRADEDDRISA
jgi:hypothetical protein